MTELDDVDVEEPSTSWREIAREELETRLGNAVVGFLGLTTFIVLQRIAFTLNDAGAPKIAVETAAMFALTSLAVGVVFLASAVIATVIASF